VELGFPSVGDPLIPPGHGCLITKHLKLVQIRFGGIFLCGCFRFGVSKCGGPHNSTGQGLLNLQKSKNSPNGGGIGDLCRGGGGGGHYRAWRGLGAWY
jgi:hypothetical protein